MQDEWQWCTTVREQRSDGHVAALAVFGIDGLEAAVLPTAERGIELELFEQWQGWERRHLEAAVSRFGQHGIVDSGGGLTNAGRSIRTETEDLTDRHVSGTSPTVRYSPADDRSSS